MTSTMSTPFEGTDEGWGVLNMSLKTGDEMERMSLWTRKSRLSVPWVARRITSPSGQLNISSDMMPVAGEELWKRRDTGLVASYD